MKKAGTFLALQENQNSCITVYNSCLTPTALECQAVNEALWLKEDGGIAPAINDTCKPTLKDANARSKADTRSNILDDCKHALGASG